MGLSSFSSSDEELVFGREDDALPRFGAKSKLVTGLDFDVTTIALGVRRRNAIDFSAKMTEGQ